MSLSEAFRAVKSQFVQIQPITKYHKGAADLEIGQGFFRKSPVLARDISVLVAASQLKEEESIKETTRWLDRMAGCEIRLRSY